MAQILELFAMVKKQDRSPASPIVQIIRTYESKGRADQDLELLGDIDVDGAYAVLTIPHID